MKIALGGDTWVMMGAQPMVGQISNVTSSTQQTSTTRMTAADSQFQQWQHQQFVQQWTQQPQHTNQHFIGPIDAVGNPFGPSAHPQPFSNIK